jgi:hypothetical protein
MIGLQSNLSLHPYKQAALRCCWQRMRGRIEANPRMINFSAYFNGSGSKGERYCRGFSV